MFYKSTVQWKLCMGTRHCRQCICSKKNCVRGGGTVAYYFVHMHPSTQFDASFQMDMNWAEVVCAVIVSVPLRARLQISDSVAPAANRQTPAMTLSHIPPQSRYRVARGGMRVFTTEALLVMLAHSWLFCAATKRTRSDSTWKTWIARKNMIQTGF